MTDEKLIDALRRMSPRLDMLDCESVLTAADRIEAQAAEIERLRGDLAKAVEALELIVVDNTWGLEHETYMKCRTTLAALTGAKP